MTAPFRRFFRPAESEVITQEGVQLTEATSKDDLLYVNAARPGAGSGEVLAFTYPGGNWLERLGISTTQPDFAATPREMSL